MDTKRIYQDYLSSGFNIIDSDRVGALGMLSVEQLITMYNGFVQEHAELEEYLGASNTFDVIGKARNEGVHSAFLKELIAGKWYDEKSKENTATHLLDIILARAENQGKRNEINEELRRAILTRSLSFGRAIGECELTVDKYLTRYGLNTQALTDVTNKDKHIDIYLRLELKEKFLGRDCIELFIENKVQSKEHNNQTEAYYDECNNGGFKRPFQIFIYLSPLPLQRINCYDELEESERPSCSHYISICYQDILDTIIEPLRTGKRYTTQELVELNDYVSCLELPALPDNKDSSTGSLSIMATSQYERMLIDKFLSNPVNRFLYEHALALQNGVCLYRTVSEISLKCCGTPSMNLEAFGVTNKFHLLTDYELISHLVKRYFITLIQREDEILRQLDDCKVVGHQKGAKLFLIWSPESCHDNLFLHYFDTNLYEYRGKAYKNISYALSDAIKDYVDEHCEFVDIVKMFAPVYAKKGAVKPCFTTENDDMKPYRRTNVESLFIRKDIDVDKLSAINAILGEGYCIQPLSTSLFRELHECGTKNGDVLCPKATPSVTYQSVDKKDYIQIDGTDFYYRRLFEPTKLVNLNAMLSSKCIELQDERNPDIQLLNMFVKNHQSLLFSVQKIRTEL